MEKVLFLITTKSSNNTGQGGHYYSLLTYVAELKRLYDITILHYSEIEETVLDTQEALDVSYIRVDDLIKLHSFDYGVFQKVIFFGMPEADIQKIKHVCLNNDIVTISIKTGSSNPKFYYPYFDYIVLFSLENYEWFTKRYFFRNQSDIKYLPNRITKLPINHARLKDIRLVKEGFINIVKIAKIGTMYKESFIKTINLHNKLTESGLKVNTVLIGSCSDAEVRTELKRYTGDDENIVIVTDVEHTRHARELLPLFDVAVGTGRGFMEAVSKKKIALGISENHDIPIVVDRGNYDEFKKYNFSLRVTYHQNTTVKEFDKVKKAVLDDQYRRELTDEMYENFCNDYDSKAVFDFFKNTKFGNRPTRMTMIKDYALHLLLINTRMMINKISGAYCNFIMKRKYTETKRNEVF